MRLLLHVARLNRLGNVNFVNKIKIRPFLLQFDERSVRPESEIDQEAQEMGVRKDRN